jgi:glycosyltransferase involved in cell wall biosynthesis
MNADARGLRVLMVDSEKSWRGGQGQVFLLMRGLADAGAAVTLAAPADGELYARCAALPVERAPWPGRAGVSSLARLRRILAGGGYSVVHSHAARAHGAVAVARVGLRPRTPHVVSRRVDFTPGKSWFSAWKYRRGADAYIAISQGVRDVLVGGGVAPERISVAPSGIDLARYDAVRDPGYLRAEFRLRDGERVVGNVAALAPHKSQADLLRAAALVRARRRDVRFFVVGEGALRGELEALARTLGVDEAVVFTGFRTDALELIRLFDVFVMSSYLEGLGTSIMDAQCLGIPVVATRTGGIPEIVEDGVSGLLVPPRDPPALAAALARMLDDDALRKRCVHGASARAAGYDYRRTVYKTLDVYRRLCDVHDPLGRDRAA